MAEMYWQALARDVPFATYATDPTIAKAAADLSRLSDFGGPEGERARSPLDTVFRTGLAGEDDRPVRLPVPLAAGALRRLMTMAAAVPRAPVQGLHDHLRCLADGAAAAATARRSPPAVPASPPPTRYMMAGRDLRHLPARRLQLPGILQCRPDPATSWARWTPGNPYLQSKNQAGVGTFGPHHLLDLVAKVANAAVKACWYQKWLVHRRVRPEEFGGRVYLHKTGVAAVAHPRRPAHHIRCAGRRLPRATAAPCCPSPTRRAAPCIHPIRAAHPAITGACVTILKAFFDEAAVLPNPVIANADGSALLPYSGPPLTVGGELNKLAGNLAAGRAFGGVHWRSDNLVGLQLGEAVALSILADERRTYNETFRGFSLTTFDGRTVNA